MSRRQHQPDRFGPPAQGGLSLVELMVALVIGTILVGGALTLFINSKASYRVNAQINAMQDVGRFAHHVLVADLRLAGYWGDTNAAAAIVGGKGYQQLSTTASGDCYGYTSLGAIVAGANNSDPYGSCIPASDYQSGTDILIVRHAEPTPVNPSAQKGQVYVRSSGSGGVLFVSGIEDPGGYAGDDVRLASMDVYYVRPYTSTPGDGRPALHMETLSVVGSSPAMVDEEIASGVEDFQVQFGVDTDGDGSVNEYVDPGTIPSGATVVAVRFWLLVRAAHPDAGYTNNVTYTLASASEQFHDHYRRLLQVSTVQLRNAITSTVP